MSAEHDTAARRGQRDGRREGRRRPLVLAAAGVAGAAVLVALVLSATAQRRSTPTPSKSGQRILHEYVPPPSKRAASRWAREGRLPDHIRVEDRLLPKPKGGDEPRKSERVIGRKMDRATSLRPDRKTTHDGVLRYTAEFNPSVVPFKRMTSLDAVRADFSLGVRDKTPREVPLAKRPTPPDREAFWGSLVLDVVSGKLHPIPSVGASAVIVSYRAKPESRVRFFRDSADNISITAERSGRLRLVFLTDAPRSYYSPEIPALVTTANVPSDLRPRVPQNVLAAAAKVLTHIGIGPTLTLRRQLDRLIAYFRNFEAKPLARSTRGNTYLDIALSQRGVCRHRSYAFVITAQSLGIPARYVHNQAHAFAEAYVPRLGWVRIDLGGASSELRVGNAHAKAVHNPGPDPFPRPSAYAGNYSQLRGNVTGLKRGQRLRHTGTNLRSFARSRRAAAAAAARGRLGASAGGRIGGGGGGGGAGGGAGGAPGAGGRTSAPLAGGTARTQPAGPVAPNAPTRQPTKVTVDIAKNSARRGQRVRVWGRVLTSEGRAAANLRVELYLSRDGRSAQALLGAAITDATGRYDVELPVPRNISVGRYRVYAATPGDQRHEASLSK